MLEQRIIITGSVIINGISDQPITGFDVGIEGKFIKAIRKTGEFDQDWCSSDIMTIDASGKWLLPGLINMHDHIVLRDQLGDPIKYAAKSDHTRLIVNGIRNCITALQRGWTTVRDMGAPDLLGLRIGKLVDEGVIPGPKIISCGCPICVTGGHAWPICIEADGKDAVRKAARKLFKEGADFIKVMASEDPYPQDCFEKTFPEMRYEEIEAAFDEALIRGKGTACHAMGTKAIDNVLKAKAQIISHGFYLSAKLAERMVEQNVFLDPTLSSYGVQTISPARKRGEKWIRKHMALLKPMKRSFTKALNAGVKIIAGTDTAGFLAEDIALMRKFGLNSMESIRTATINSANALKLGNRIGSIEEGKIADLVILDGDPLSDASNIEKVHMVFKEGVFYKPHDIRLDDSELQNALSR